MSFNLLIFIFLYDLMIFLTKIKIESMSQVGKNIVTLSNLITIDKI